MPRPAAPIRARPISCFFFFCKYVLSLASRENVSVMLVQNVDETWFVGTVTC